MNWRETIAVFGYILPAIICALAGVFMAINKIDGWGWLLFAAMVLIPSRIRFGKAAEIDALRELEESRRKEP